MVSFQIFCFFCFICVVLCLREKSKKETYTYMSSFSKYEAIRGDVRDIPTVEGCIPQNFWIFHRHGTRFPSSSEITLIETLLALRDAVISNHKQGRGTLSKRELNRLKKWSFNSSIEAIPLFLTQEGYNETYRTSLRYKKRFSSLLNRPYSPNDFYFQHSETQRTLVTSHAFIDGLFGIEEEENVVDVVLPSDKDYLLYDFGGACAKLSEEIVNPNVYEESKLFLQTSYATEAIQEISIRLGFKETLQVGYLTAIWDACGYDSAWNQETERLGPWCPTLGKKGREIGEYYSDLNFKSMSGYGQEVTERGGCAPPTDLWERFATATGELNVENKTESVVALFSHDNYIMMIHTSLGLLKDDPPITADNFKHQANRQWRTSTIVPFAANVAAILYKCQDSESKTLYKVSFLRNELPWEGIPNCPGGICSWENFRNFVKPVAESCNYSSFC